MRLLCRFGGEDIGQAGERLVDALGLLESIALQGEGGNMLVNIIHIQIHTCTYIYICVYTDVRQARERLVDALSLF